MEQFCFVEQKPRRYEDHSPQKKFKLRTQLIPVLFLLLVISFKCNDMDLTTATCYTINMSNVQQKQE